MLKDARIVPPSRWRPAHEKFYEEIVGLIPIEEYAGGVFYIQVTERARS